MRAAVMMIAIFSSVSSAWAQPQQEPLVTDHTRSLRPTDSLCNVRNGSRMILREALTIPAGASCVERSSRTASISQAPTVLPTTCQLCRGTGSNSSSDLRVDAGSYSIRGHSCSELRDGGYGASLSLAAPNRTRLALVCSREEEFPHVGQFVDAWIVRHDPPRPHSGPYILGDATPRSTTEMPAKTEGDAGVPAAGASD